MAERFSSRPPLVKEGMETIALTEEVTAIQIRGRRMAAAVLLVQALGGGWTTADLPSPAAVTKP